MPSALIIACAALALVACEADHKPAPPPPGTTVVEVRPRVRLAPPKDGNLQYLTYWVAEGAELFAAEGVDVEVVDLGGRGPAQPLQAGEADVAVLAPPQYLRLIERRAEIALVANLLANDGIGLVVQRDVAAARGVTATMPVRERLERLRGARIGIASGPPPRLRALYRDAGLDADRDLAIVSLDGDAQDRAFATGEVDALYAHTPHLERALVDRAGVLIVDQSAGEIGPLAGRQIHALVARRAFIVDKPAAVEAVVRAIAAALTMLRERPDDAIAALARRFPDVDRRHLARIVEIYARAVPATPHVSADGFAAALALFPGSQTPPDLTGVDLAPYVDDRFATAAGSGSRAR